MPFSKDKEFKYSFRGINRIIEERGNQFIRFAQIAWVGEDEEVDDSKIKYDLRKYVTGPDGKEKMLKGLTFLSNDGPHELTNILTEEGFGNTEKILNNIKSRPDFPNAVKSVYGENVDSESDIFDLRDIL